MILDAFLEFTETRVGDPIATATHGTNIIDLGVGRQNGPGAPPFGSNPLGVAIPSPERGGGARDMGIGDDPAIKILAQIVGNVVGGTSLQLAIEGAPDAAYGTVPPPEVPAVPGNWRAFAYGPVLTVAELNRRTAPGGGSRLFDVDMPRVPWTGPLPRYLRMAFIRVGAFTGGHLRALLVLDRYDQIISTQGFESGYVPGVTVPN